MTVAARPYPGLNRFFIQQHCGGPALPGRDTETPVEGGGKTGVANVAHAFGYEPDRESGGSEKQGGA